MNKQTDFNRSRIIAEINSMKRGETIKAAIQNKKRNSVS